MVRYLADTSAWNRSTQAVGRWTELLEVGDVALCAPVRLKLLFSARGAGEYARLARDYRLLPDLPIDARATALAERTQEGLAQRAQHRGPTPVDLLVAAIAELHGVTVLHHDRHFEVIARVTGQATEWLPPRRTG
ncbi:MAG: PIN domain-containing protein [Actinomycetota bacterium]|nr:PIN domain-containing protein [Actinomycetota bacterium]